MIDIVCGDTDTLGGALWIDVCAPTPEEIELLASERGIPHVALEECLVPRQLPKHERLDAKTFLVVRVYDEESRADADAFPEMTRKLGVFLADRFLVTLHRRSLPFLELAKDAVRGRSEPIYLQVVLLDILLAGVETFHAPLERAELRIHEFESSLLEEETTALSIAWKDVFRTKVRIATLKRLLWHTQNATQKYVPRASVNQPRAEELRERLASLSFFAESLDSDLDNLLAVQLSLTANKTNDVMRLLTLFSAVFLPITFIVGVYGMNFLYMPELSWRYGYEALWLFIIATVVGVVMWFRRRGWIGPR